MKRVLIFFLLMTIVAGSFSQTVGFIRRYDGSIGKESVVLNLKIIDTTLQGSFYFVKVGQTILLSGSILNEVVSAKEVFNDSVIGIFSGTSTPDFTVIKGTLKNSASSNPVSFNWKQSHAAGSAILGVVASNREYVWKTNSNGEHLGASGTYSYCYITSFGNDSVKLKVNGELLEGAATDSDALSLKESALDLMQEDFSDYQDAFDSAFANSNTEQDAKFMDESPQIYKWDQQSSWEAIYNENYILSVRAFYYEYRGGAHGNYSYSNIVFSLKSGEELSPENLFKPGYENQLKQLALIQLEKQFKAPSADALKQQGFFLSNGLELTDNIFIQKNGIGFTYNPYEIAPYSFGSIDIFIPWSSLQSWIKPDGPLSWAIVKK